MLGAAIIVFREVIEAGLIVGIVLAATRGIAGRGTHVTLGIAAGLFGAILVALFAGGISDAFEGSGQELFNAGVLSAAVIMLTWHNVWMARHGREIAAEMVSVGRAVSSGERSLAALTVVVGLAVLREGAEVVLFLYGVVVSGTGAGEMIAGILLGVLAGAALTALTYAGLIAIPSRYVFSVTTVLIALLAAGMAAQAVQFYDAAGVINVGVMPVWDSSGFIAESSLVGKLLHTLIGYTERPTQMQIAVYLATIIVMAGLMVLTRPAPRINKASA
jgi:high-affinity iron transporter